jgi:cytochrome o ubiquinol oxidase subunit II
VADRRAKLIWIRCLAAPLFLAGCEPGLLDPAGPVAAGEKQILFNSVAIMLAIIVPVIVLTLFFAWRYRASNEKATYAPEWSYSGRLELLVWSIPALAILFLGGIAWVGSHDLEPSRPLKSNQPPLQVQVISLDWKWLFIYPEQGIASVNHLVLPVGRPVAFRITSGTVMNSFMVPRLGSQMYAMAGMDGKLHYQADVPGRYRGLSAHYSGEGFSDMDFFADAVRPDQFAAWAAQVKAKQSPVLDGRSYVQFAKKAATEEPFTFRAVAPGLYDAALKQAGAPVHDTAEQGREDMHKEKLP